MTRRPNARDRARVFKALADPHRLGIIDALAEHGSMCGTELSERLGVSLALLCHHWDVLLDAGLVKKQRVGQLRICTLDAERLREAVQPFQAGARPEEAMVSAGAKSATKAAKRAPKATAAKTRAHKGATAPKRSPKRSRGSR